MPLQLSTAVRNAVLDAIESTTGTAPTLELRTGSVPANCAAADTGSVAATLTLPSDWLANAASASKALAGTWQVASAAGNASPVAHFRIKQGATCHLQGTVTATGGGGDLTLDNTTINAGQTVTITAFTLNAANG